MSDEVTKVTVRLGAKLTADFNSKTVEIEVTDHVRPGIDKNTSAAIERVWNLVESKIEEKLNEDD